jgi:hypothetical protein
MLRTHYSITHMHIKEGRMQAMEIVPQQTTFLANSESPCMLR